ncbi:hypothetical protein AB1K91_05300 [Terribacillus sp. 179-K 1B1 HS]|uniref:hypothetical protein n=1 Tax=Terribacillus sp. 179-K 1B1 HS TaxID=3142388 RepID=UPI00399F32EC
MEKVRVTNGKNYMIVQKSMIPVGYQIVEVYKEPVKEDFTAKTEAQLKKVKKEDLAKYLDENNVEYSAEAKKDDLIKAIKADSGVSAAE